MSIIFIHVNLFSITLSFRENNAFFGKKDQHNICSGEPSSTAVPARLASLYAMDEPGPSLPHRPSTLPFVPTRVRTNGFTVPGPPPFPPPGHPSDPFGHPPAPSISPPLSRPSHANKPFAHAPAPPPFLPVHSTDRYHGDLLPAAPIEPVQRLSKFGPMPPIIPPDSTPTSTKQISPPRLIHLTLAATPVQHLPHPVAQEQDYVESSPMDIETSPSQCPSNDLFPPAHNPRLSMPTPAILVHLPNTTHPSTPTTPSNSKVSPVPRVSSPKQSSFTHTPRIPLPPPLPSASATSFTHSHMNTSFIPMPPSLHAPQPSTPFPPTLPPLPMPPFVPSLTPTALPSKMTTPYTPWDGEIKDGTVPHQLINHWTGKESASSPVPTEQLSWSTVLDKP